MKVYELPDEKVSLVWSNQDGKIARYNPEHGDWYDENGNNDSRSMHFKNRVPVKGRWLPWTPPTFPERVKCPRRCWATIKDGINEGKRVILVHFPYDKSKTDTSYRYNGWWYWPGQLTDIVWIDKEEYEDELQGCNHDVPRSN
jgi:hypothetical protein